MFNLSSNKNKNFIEGSLLPRIYHIINFYEYSVYFIVALHYNINSDPSDDKFRTSTIQNWHCSH